MLLLSFALAGAWIRSPGGSYTKLSAGAFSAAEYVDPLTGESSPLRYRGLSSELYGELGLPGGLQVELGLPWLWGRNQDPRSGEVYRSAGPGDARLGVGLDLRWWALPSSLSLRARVPLYDQAELPSFYPALGDENVDLDLVFAAGGGFGPGLWLQGELGYRWRSGWAPSGNPVRLDLVDGLPYHLQAGWVPNLEGRPGGWVYLDLSGLVRLDPSENSRAWHQWGAGFALPLGRGLHAELAGQHVYAASAASRGLGASVGLSLLR